jgi:hypothetical protein
MRNALALVVLTAPFAAPLPAQSLGSPAPKIEAVRWYNTPGFEIDDLKGKAVLVDVFRTW